MADDKTFNVLFLDVRNAARSIIAEKVLDRYGGGRFKGHSGGSDPVAQLHPFTIDILKNQNYMTDELKPKNYKDFLADGAPTMDFIFSIGHESVNELAPDWPGDPMKAHWGINDPMAVEGTEAERRFAFADVMRMITQRIDIFVNLPLTGADNSSLQERLDSIGAEPSAPA